MNVGELLVECSLWLHGSSLVVFNVNNDDGDEDLVATVHRLPDPSKLRRSNTPVPLAYTRYPSLGLYQSTFHRLNHAQPTMKWIPGKASPEAYYCIPSPPIHENFVQDAIFKLSSSGAPSLIGFCRSGSNMAFSQSSESRLLGLRHYLLSSTESRHIFVDSSLFDLESNATYRARLQTSLKSSDWRDMFTEGLSRRTRTLAPFCVRSGRLLVVQNGVRFAMLTLED